MSHVTDGKNVTNDAVAVAVDVGGVILDVLDDHLALELATLLGVKANVVGVLVPVERGHIELTGGRVGRLTVVEDNGLVSVGNRAARSCAASVTAGATATHEAASSHRGHAKATILEEFTTRKCHNVFPFLLDTLQTRPISRDGLRPPRTY